VYFELYLNVSFFLSLEVKAQFMDLKVPEEKKEGENERD
jgi:hypothetical protein